MSSEATDGDLPPTKRARLDQDASAVATDTTSAVAATTVLAPASATASAVGEQVAAPSDPFSFEHETGLFKTLKDSLGRRAATEEEVGVTEYADSSVPPFAGIIKHRFTDFLVYEVGLDGQVVKLKDIRGPQQQKRQEKKEEEPVKAETAPVPAETSKAEPVPLWSVDAIAVFKPLLTAEKLTELEAFITEGPAPKGTPKSAPRRLYRSSTIESKDSRTAFHKGLRAAFDGKLASEMKELEDGSQVIEVSWRAGGGKGNARGDKTRRGDGAQEDRMSKAEMQAIREQHPPFIHFTLQKTNKEMHDALGGLLRFLNLGPQDLGTAGTKDKRAVTVQRVSMRRGNRTIEEVWRAAKSGDGGGARGGRGGRGRGRGGYGGGWSGPDRGVRIGDVEYGTEMFELGMLKGNKFVVTLRDVTVDSPDTIQRAMNTLSTRGFVNYYGMQRFGTAPVPTHAIGLALLRSDWKLAAHLILRERDGEGEDIAHARQVWQEGKAKEALRLMPRRAVAERAVLEGLVRSSTDVLSALSRIPKNLRMMYVHSWQSYIWNQVVSERIKLHGCDKPVVGDLVLIGEDTEDKEAVDEEADMPAAPPVEALDPDLDAAEPAPTANPASSALNLDRALATSRAPKARVLTQEDIDAGTHTIFDVVLPMPGYATVYPEGQLGERYKAIMRADGIDPDNMFRKQKEYSLGGTYRKIMHLATDVTHRMLVYQSPNDDLAQSDEDILLGRAPPKVVPYDAATMPWPLDKDAGHVALQIEMTLGSSTYCTMALREVLKTATSGAHQRKLTEQMEERLQNEAQAGSAPAPAGEPATADVDVVMS